MLITTRFFLLLSLLFASAYADNKQVLLLHSYHKGYKWSDTISQVIEEKLATDLEIELTTVYMDTQKIADPIYLDKLASLYKEQFEKRKLDLVIACDNNAFDFVIRFHPYLFSQLPVLFCGINNFDKALLDENNIKQYMSGVTERIDLEGNFKLILDLHPKLQNLVIINDKSKTGYAVKRDLLPILKMYEKKTNIIYIDTVDVQTIQNQLSTLGQNTVMLFILFSKDSDNHYYSYKQGFAKIKASSDIPIYGIWDLHLGSGIVGGLLTTATSQGANVADMAMEVLSGADILQIPIRDGLMSEYIFDQKELERLGISLKSTLSKYTLINQESSIYEDYRDFYIGTLLVIVALGFLVIAMRVNIQKRKKLQKELSNQLTFQKVLLDTIPSALYYKDINGKFIGCNLAFCQLVERQESQIVGQDAFAIFPEDIARKNINIDNTLIEENKHFDNYDLTVNFANKKKHFIFNKALFFASDGSVGGIVCIMDDITERVQQRQFLTQQSKLAEMGDMIAAIAHQWNEPLVTLSAVVQDIQTASLLNELDKVNIKDFVQDSMVQIQYMSNTLMDFRNFLKPSNHKHHFSVKSALEEILEIVGKQILYSNIDLQIRYAQESEFLTCGYKNEFKQVLLNLINNAKNKILALQSPKKQIIKITLKQTKKYNTIKITDYAGAIAEDIIGSIFDPYFTTKKDGMGLGLYIAKIIVEDKMQGKIFAQNRKQGVAFVIKIPKEQEGVEI